DLVEVNLKILSDLAPEATTSMQRDILAGKPSEIDGLIYQVVRLGH
ncbi:MAG: 2-dehydropantoate 2-reductase, partial [Lachnospiraceae bacterium]|nr:2-dehydropantoate 2-reductase [Lachnospiraceae bacterium]